VYISDVLDELLAELNFNENYVVVTINLTSVDNALSTLWGFNGIKGIKEKIKLRLFSSFFTK
jgi:hypothetical protein